MSGFENRDQKAIMSEMLVQRAVHGNSDSSAGALERNTVSTVRSRSDYAFDSAAENAGYEPTDLLSLPMTRVDAAKLIRTLQQLQGAANGQAPRIAVKAKGKILFLDVAEIVAVQAEGNYIALTHRTNQYFLRETLSSMAEKLKPYGFMRIHRSVIVNISAVEEIQPLPTGEYRLRVKGGKDYLVTRTYKDNLKDLAQLWIGSEHLCG
jgi:two-component system LytT family response regulator